ncbi:MAG: hypothetical protein EOO70_07405, partial [Myxococcaceae bacterium]
MAQQLFSPLVEAHLRLTAERAMSPEPPVQAPPRGHRRRIEPVYICPECDEQHDYERQALECCPEVAEDAVPGHDPLRCP